jgi:hypothetical protein
MRVAAAITLVAGCGRIGFAELGDSGSGAGDSPAGVRSTLHIDRVAPAMDLIGYVLPVVLDDSRIDRTRLAADASDLEFFDSAGNDLDLEIEQIGALGGAPLVAWVNVPTISAAGDTTIDVRYATPRDVPRRKPWDNTYDVVFHFANGGGSDSSNGNDATNMGAVSAPGILGDGVAMTGTQYMIVPATSTIASAGFTVEGWIYVSTLPSAYYALAAREVGATSDDDVYLGVFGTQALATCEHANMEFDALGGPISAGGWIYLAGTAHSMEVRVFIEGVLAGNQPVTGALQHGGSPLFLGADSNSGGSVAMNDFLMGSLDEVRISNVIRPVPWLKFTASAMRDQVITY